MLTQLNYSKALGLAVWGLLLLAGSARAQTAPQLAGTGATVATAAPVPAAFAPAAVATPALPEGIWKGPLTVPGGSLEVIFRFVKLTSGEYFGTLDVPLQKVTHLEVQVSQHDDSVQLFTPAVGSRFVGVLAAGARQLTGTWQQPGFKTSIVLTFSPAMAASAKSVRLTPPYREEEVAFGNAAANARVAGMLTVPAGPGPFPAVVLLSDAGLQDRDGTVGDFAPLGLLADYLTRHGVAVLRFDDRGTGKSGGPAAAATADLVSDAQAGLNYLRIRPEVDQAHLGLVGHGEGGNVALLAAAQPLPPAFVVALAATGLPGREAVVQQQTATLQALGMDVAQIAAATKRQQAILEIIQQTTDGGQARVIVANMLRQSNAAIDTATAQTSAAEMTSVRYRDYLAFNPLEKLPAVSCPVLLLNGTTDLTVNADANLGALARGLKLNRGVTTKKLPGVNHLFQPDPSQWPIVAGQPRPTFSPLAEETIRAWIAEQAKK